MFLDVMLKRGHKERIAVCVGDDPCVLARSFARVHSLPRGTAQQVEQLIAHHLAALPAPTA